MEGDRARHDDADFAHRSVLRHEVLEAFEEVPAGLVLDATLGGAGHATALLLSLIHILRFGRFRFG